MHVIWVPMSFKIWSTLHVATMFMQTRWLYGPLGENRSLFVRVLIVKPSQFQGPGPGDSWKFSGQSHWYCPGVKKYQSKHWNLSKISVCSDKCFWMWNEEKGTFYWSPTFYFQIKSQTPVKSRLHIQKHFSLKPIFYLNFNAFDWYLFAPCSLQTRQY